MGVLAQAEQLEQIRRLMFVGALWPTFWAVVATTGFVAVLWLMIVDGMFRRRFGLGLVLKAVACLWVGLIAAALALTKTDIGGWGVAVMLAAVGGLLIYLYSLERRFVGRGTGLTLTGLRVLLIVVVFAMLAEPVVSLTRRETRQRRVAVLIDESASMDVVDAERSPGELLRLADARGMLSELARPVKLDDAIVRLRRTERMLDRQKAWLTEMGLDAERTPRTADRGRTQSLVDNVRSCRDTVASVAERLGTVLDDPEGVPRGLRSGLIDVRERLRTQVGGSLTALIDSSGEGASPRPGTIGWRDGAGRALASSIQGLAAARNDLADLAEQLDEAHAQRADAETQRAMARVAAMSRAELARSMLDERGGGLLSALDEDVPAKVYAFAGRVRSVRRGEAAGVDGEAPTATRPATMPTTTQATGEEQRLRTDVAEALKRVVQDTDPSELAGVLLVSDARHTAGSDPLTEAKKLAGHGVAVFPVPVGASRPPMDAAILEVDAPDVVRTDDVVHVSVVVRADGLEGRMLRLRLIGEDGRALELGEHAADEEKGQVRTDKTVVVQGDHERREVELSHRVTSKGRLVWRVVLEEVEGEAFTENNEAVVAVDVTDDRTDVLLVDGLPRWEFRYLRNMLLRDEAVRLQHVLFDPALVARQPGFTPVTAKVTNDQPEADRLPDQTKDLNAFDVVIVGDVDPDDLPRDKQEMIEAFVSERGGTLVVMAGKRHMPGGYLSEPLADVIPVQRSAGSTASTQTAASDAPPEAFRVSLTQEGLQHMVTELAVETEANRELWSDLPTHYWRSVASAAKAGASVLAWAEEGSPGGNGEAATARGVDVEDARARQRERGLIVTQHYGLGKVLYLGWDATWRFRYKHGDTYHHRFWSQVLRWATTGKLPVGMKLVKLGTDRARYTTGESVTVRAKMTKPDGTGLTDAQVRAVVADGERTVTSGRMEHLEGSGGVYETRFSGLGADTYTIRLESPQIETLRQPDDPLGEVATSIVIERSRSAEHLDLTADGELMGQLADVTDGLILRPGVREVVADCLRLEPVVSYVHQQLTVWDRWPLLLVFATIAGAEWILRKRAGLM